MPNRGIERTKSMLWVVVVRIVDASTIISGRAAELDTASDR
jgi:hypothetical protein